MKFRKALTSLMALALVIGLVAPALAANDTAALQNDVNETAAFVYQTVTNPQVGPVGGEWAVIGLARSGYSVSDTYYQGYYVNVESYVKACGGVLSSNKYTEYSRVSLALTAIGKDPTNVAGYNLLAPLGDYYGTVYQGLNGPVWALIALDAGNYPMPQNPSAKTQATRQMYVDYILSSQLSDGGWSLTGAAPSDPDITGMALQALAKYQSQPEVKAATDKAVDCLSKMQNADGGYTSWSTKNSESTVQVLVALSTLGIPLDDSRFVKNGNTLTGNLLSFRNADGSFAHAANGSGNNQMSTEQALYGLAAALRAAKGQPGLYDMSDALHIGSAGTPATGAAGLPGKNADVLAMPVTLPGTTFSDIGSNAAKQAIENLASRGIINGMGDGTYAPDSTMTRAEFAAIVVRGLGLTPKANDTFTDVVAGQWYAPYIGTANTYGIVNGISDTLFNPSGTITKQEAAAMVARAAKLCGMNTSMDSESIRDTLAQFDDYTQVADWAQESVAFCYNQNILDQSDISIQPAAAINRGEMAQMICNMLGDANLL